MPLIGPVLDLLIGLMLRLLVWLVVVTVKLAARCAWSAILNHPGLVFLGVLVAQREGWVTWTYTPLALGALGVLAVVRFFMGHPPVQVAKSVQGEVAKAYRAGLAVRDGGRKARRFVTEAPDRAARKFQRAVRRAERKAPADA